MSNMCISIKLWESVKTTKTDGDRIQNMLNELNISQFGHYFVDSGAENGRISIRERMKGLRQEH